MKNMRFAAVIAAILIAVFCLSACSTINDLMGFFQSLQDIVPTDAPAGSSGIPDVIETDEEGHITKLSHYDGDGKLIFVHVQTWENGRIVNKKSYNGAGKETGSIDYEYDERGNNTVMSWFFWNSGALMKVERVYDEYDRMVESIGYGTETVSTNKTYLEYDDKDGEHPKNYYKKIYYPSYPGDRYYVTTFEYDSDGLLLKATTVDKTGALTSYEIYKNENGKLQEYTSYDAEGKQQYTYKTIYDENGKKVREERYDGEGNLVGVDY